MTVYCIENTKSARVLGAWDCLTSGQALDRLAVAAGYADYDALQDAVPAAPGEIAVHEIDPGYLRDAGSGEWDEVAARLPVGAWTLILDADAVNTGNAYTYTHLPHDVAVAVYEALGGTVTRSDTVAVDGKDTGLTS